MIKSFLSNFFLFRGQAKMAAFPIIIAILLFSFSQGFSGGSTTLLPINQEQVIENMEIMKQNHEQICNKDLILLTCNGSSSASGESMKRNSLQYARHELPHQAFLELNLDSSDWLNCISYTRSPLDGYEMQIIEVDRKLIGNGAHRQLHSSIKVKWKERKGCEVVMVEKLPRGIFADMFELDGHVVRGAYVSATIYGDHNLELPALHSGESIIVLHSNVEAQVENIVQVNVSLPLHARYPPLSLDSHVVVSLNIPYILFHCVGDVKVVPNALWSVLTWNGSTKPSRLQWAVPSGNPSHSRVVAIVTACTALSGVVILFVVSMKSFKIAGKKESHKEMPSSL